MRVDSLDQLEGALSTITSSVPLAAVTWRALYTDCVARTAPMDAVVTVSEELVYVAGITRISPDTFFSPRPSALSEKANILPTVPVLIGL